MLEIQCFLVIPAILPISRNIRKFPLFEQNCHEKLQLYLPCLLATYSRLIVSDIDKLPYDLDPSNMIIFIHKLLYSPSSSTP